MQCLQSPLSTQVSKASILFHEQGEWKKKKSNPWAASLWRKGLNLALTKLPMREKGDLEYSTKLSQEEKDLKVPN